MYDDVPPQSNDSHNFLSPYPCRLFRSVWDPVLMGYYGETETTQYPVGFNPQLVTSRLGESCQAIGKRKKGRSWVFGKSPIQSPIRKLQSCRLRVTCDTRKGLGDSDNGGHHTGRDCSF